MVLAAYGTHVSESGLKAQARMVAEGTPIEELERLARRYGLVADLQDITVERRRQALEEGKMERKGLERAFLLTGDREATSFRPCPEVPDKLPAVSSTTSSTGPWHAWDRTTRC